MSLSIHFGPGQHTTDSLVRSVASGMLCLTHRIFRRSSSQCFLVCTSDALLPTKIQCRADQMERLVLLHIVTFQGSRDLRIQTLKSSLEVDGPSATLEVAVFSCAAWCPRTSFLVLQLASVVGGGGGGVVVVVPPPLAVMGSARGNSTKLSNRSQFIENMARRPLSLINLQSRL